MTSIMNRSGTFNGDLDNSSNKGLAKLNMVSMEPAPAQFTVRCVTPPCVRPLAQLVLHTPGRAQSSVELVAGSPTHCEAGPDYTYAASVQ